MSLLRVSLGLVFLGFGLLKFFPGTSPAEALVQQTVSELTFGLIPEDVGLVLTAVVESTIGLTLISGRFLRFGLALLGVAMIGIMSPMVLMFSELFPQPLAPTLEAQYGKPCSFQTVDQQPCLCFYAACCRSRYSS
ncbi:MAG: DoxX family membrane protein [Actinobacteria bacterium]|nr:DoxX family membrane protein [Actinomycetota bacterium]